MNERLAALRLQPVGNTSAEFKLFLEAAVKKFAELARLAGIEPE